MSTCCCIVPPYLLRAIAASSENPDHVRNSAHKALVRSQSFHEDREAKLKTLATPAARRTAVAPHGIVPDEILSHIAEHAEHPDQRDSAQKTLEHSQALRAKRSQPESVHAPQALFAKATQSGFYRAVYDANHTEDEDSLPGKLVLTEGGKAVSDTAVMEAYANTGYVLDFYKQVFNWNSVDNKGMHVVSSVHFSNQYENAFWSGTQMVFGDGNTFLYHFTRSLDVIGHEMTHGVTEHTAALDYDAQSGALNESVSDIFGIMIKQWHEKTLAKDADWVSLSILSVHSTKILSESTNEMYLGELIIAAMYLIRLWLTL
jgi:Zn-dependent metalloprotease